MFFNKDMANEANEVTVPISITLIRCPFQPKLGASHLAIHQRKTPQTVGEPQKWDSLEPEAFESCGEARSLVKNRYGSRVDHGLVDPFLVGG